MSLSEQLDFVDAAGLRVAVATIYVTDQWATTLVRLDSSEAKAYAEEALQLVEGARYEYELQEQGLRLADGVGSERQVVRQSLISGRKHCGQIHTGLYTGTLTLFVKDEAGAVVGTAAVEVRSRKLSYRNDYRTMMEDIASQCVDLLMDISIPSTQSYAPDPGRTPQTIAQRYSFIKGLLGTNEFSLALHRVASNPHQQWRATPRQIDTHRPFRTNAAVARQLVKGARRHSVPNDVLPPGLIASIPTRIAVSGYEVTDDSLENRFVKFTLETFQSFLAEMLVRLAGFGEANGRLYVEIKTLRDSLVERLSLPLFRKVSALATIPFSSPSLQRKEGYREVLQAWIRFNLAARLDWSGGDDVYGVGQKNVALLYEYWAFFQLLRIVSTVTGVAGLGASNLIESTADGIGLKLKSGRHTCLEGRTSFKGRDLSVRLSYNRSFGKSNDYARSGSWSTPLRPDYTLSLWPSEFLESEAEEQEIISHIHFDAKYKLEDVSGAIEEEVDVWGNANEGAFVDSSVSLSVKREDLLKMHAYRDAIKRSQGAYVLYPGNQDRNWSPYSEILPGVGAFSLRPGANTGILSSFVQDVMDNVCDRASRRERHGFHAWRVNEERVTSGLITRVPEKEINSGNRLPPLSETLVLVGWYKGPDHLEWILRNAKYNFRMDAENGSLRLSPEVCSARYLLLHTHGGRCHKELFLLGGSGPRVFSGQKMIEMQYPSQNPRRNYLVFDITPTVGFNAAAWNYNDVPELVGGLGSAAPQVIRLDTLLMAVRAR